MGARRSPYPKGTFRAVHYAEPGRMWLVCEPCRRYLPLYLTMDIADRQMARTRFVCRRCGAAGGLTNDDPASDPRRQGYELDLAAIELQRRANPPPPPPVWLPASSPALEAVQRNGTPILAEIDWRPVVLVLWIDDAWHANHDGRPIAGAITRWRYWEGDTSARKALGL
jgi:hypothetical protein